MIRVLFSLLLLALIATACPGLADDQPSELKADEAYGVLHAEERVIDLPADQGKWHISVVGKPADPKPASPSPLTPAVA